MIRIITVYLVSISLAALPSACSKSEPLRLGFVGGLTGRVADLGIAGRNGALLAVEERNAAGGVNGRQVELIIRDDEQDPATAKRVVTELISSRVAAIIGPMTSSIAMETVPLVNSAKTLMVSPTVTTSDLTGKDDYFFRVISDTQSYAAKNAGYMYSQLGRRKAVAIYDMGNKAYTESWLKHFRTTFEGLGGTMPLQKPFKSGNDTAFAGPVKELLAAKPDLVVIIANAVDAATISQQLRKLDPQVQLTLAEWAATERFLEMGGAAVDGAYVDQYFNRDDKSAKFSAFLQNYRKRFSMEPGFPGIAAYDAANLVLDAMSRTSGGKTLREAILATPTFQGLQQTISFDRFGDSQRKTYISTVKSGRFVVIE
jgi:branched-chain amino acid transport system substrate-binding protein